MTSSTTAVNTYARRRLASLSGDDYGATIVIHDNGVEHRGRLIGVEHSAVIRSMGVRTCVFLTSDGEDRYRGWHSGETLCEVLT